ncbi:hypothetical protein F511_41294 [Dorcoceras hygrometricum]|uniref:Uncharacterized protein n=1 Tax=Dorcoceras hygrometricum TaxID=472368 RepID=A0A2Z7APS5_9LAMI|nr:hypothetical protein F511_41294 [Dorcoceras hygrometricum]
MANRSQQGVESAVLPLALASCVPAAGLLVPPDPSSSADHDVITDDIIIDVASCHLFFVLCLDPTADYADVTTDVIIANPSIDSAERSNWFELFFSVPAAGLLVPTDLSSSADHDVVTDDIIIDGPLGCSSWFPFDVPAGPSSSSSACSWFISFQLVHYTPAGSTCPPPDFEQQTQLWTSPLLIQLPFTMINQTNC